MFRVRPAAVSLALLLGACSAPHSSPHAIDTGEARIFHGSGGQRASWDELIDAASSSEVVFLGENHGHLLGLATAAKIFDEVLARSPNAALALEFFERDEQSRLDDYLSGVSDLAALEKSSERSASNFPPGHRRMVDSAKRAGRPVHAANAPWQYTTLARKEGYERLAGLTPEQRRLFLIPPAVITGRYRADFERVMTPSDPKDRPEPEDLARRLAAAFHAQQLWDWTMADSISTALASGETPVVHVVGHFHVDFHGGTVQALDRLRLGTKTLVITFMPVWSDALRDEDRERADFIVYVGPQAQ